MGKKYFLLALIFLASSGFVFSEDCENPGEVVGDSFCSEYGFYENLKIGGETCLNNYECFASSCIEGVCQSRYQSFEDRTKFLQDLWNFFSGEECDPYYDTEYRCVGMAAYLCGQNYVWEEKGEIPGVCGVPPLETNETDQNDTDTDQDNNNNGGSSGSGINMVIFSPRNVTYSNPAVPLKVADSRDNAKFWKYSLNGDADVSFVPNSSVTAKSGLNTIVVKSSKSSSFSPMVTKTVSFTLVSASSTPRCGDNICESNEGCETCSEDCGICLVVPPSSRCGDGTCDADESSATCSEDCVPLKKSDRMWMFYLLVVILGGGFLFVTFLLGRKLGFLNFGKKGDGSSDSLSTGSVPPSIPPSNYVPPVSVSISKN